MDKNRLQLLLYFRVGRRQTQASLTWKHGKLTLTEYRWSENSPSSETEPQGNYQEQKALHL